MRCLSAHLAKKMTTTKHVETVAGADTHQSDSSAAKNEAELNPIAVDPNMLIQNLAKALKSVPQIKPPEWAAFAKTGIHKERPPAQSDWWHLRAAAVLRSVAKLGPVGTQKLRTKFGGKHSRGFKSERFAKGSGNILRKALQQLEKAGLVKQAVKGVHKGRVITDKASALFAAAIKAAGDGKRQA